jgi:enterochelin esterase-like enzyme
MLQKFLILFICVFSLRGSAQSQFFTDSLFSKSLNEIRLLTVYLPNGYGFNDSINYPVIYTTDGQLINESYRHCMDSLVVNKLVKPFILIGSHSNETMMPHGGEMRNYDYLPGNPEIKSPYSDRFDNHMSFFTQELVNYTESKYQVSKKPEERSFYGVSNGADFGVSLGLAHSDKFKNFILLSIFQGTKIAFKWNKNDALWFYIGYGLEEPKHVKREALRMKKYFAKNKIPHVLVKWVGGHERKQWEQTFIKSLIQSPVLK